MFNQTFVYYTCSATCYGTLGPIQRIQKHTALLSALILTSVVNTHTVFTVIVMFFPYSYSSKV